MRMPGKDDNVTLGENPYNTETGAITFSYTTNDMGSPLADGFYFTVIYPGMTGLQLTRELMYYGIAVFPLDTMGSLEQGVRICTSFFSDNQHDIFRERIELFHQNNK